MKAWLLNAQTGIQSIHIAEIPGPEAGKDEAAVALAFAALNPADRYLAEAQYPAKPTFPHILGRDGVGTVLDIGPDVSSVKKGDRVVVLRSEIGVNRAGTFAERVAVPVESLARIPAGWTDEQACAAPLVYLTAYQALTQWTDLPEKSVVLITGASGGVGVASTQLAKAMGYRVVALSRSSEKQRELLKLGAEFVFNPESETWSKECRAKLAPAKVNLVIDNIGGPLFSKTLDLLAMHGRVSVVGRLAGPVPEFNTAALFFRRLRIGGVAVGSYTPDESQAAFSALLKLMDATGDRPVIDHVFSFADLPKAFDWLEQGPMGKVLISIPK